jgi:hypothetical protein
MTNLRCFSSRQRFSAYAACRMVDPRFLKVLTRVTRAGFECWPDLQTQTQFAPLNGIETDEDSSTLQPTLPWHLCIKLDVVRGIVDRMH